MLKRLAAKLWKLSRTYGVKTKEGVLIDLNLSIIYLADMFGTTRETVLRAISNLIKLGLIEYKKKIIVKDIDELLIYFIEV